MEGFLYWGVSIVSQIHNTIMTLNDNIEYGFSDKELHFIVIGVIGMMMLLVLHPIFTYLAKRGYTIVISFLYVFTVIVVITFAIEIGQRITNTGNMEFADISAGVMGFLAAFIVFACVRGIYILIRRALKKE